MITGSCLILANEILALLVGWRSCSYHGSRDFSFFAARQLDRSPCTTLVLELGRRNRPYWGGELSLFEHLCSLLLETGPRGREAPVDATTHWHVETTTAASSRIIGDSYFLTLGLGEAMRKRISVHQAYERIGNRKSHFPNAWVMKVWHRWMKAAPHRFFRASRRHLPGVNFRTL